MDVPSRRRIAIAAVGLVISVLVAVVGVALAGGGTITPAQSTGCPAGAPASIEGASLDSEQLNNAAVIASVGRTMGIPQPGETIAIATALQESDLRNVHYGDRDSLGLFQQRPSQGWGSPAQILDPTYAAQQFYLHLLAVSGWRAMSTTAAAQAVQRSAYPDAYAKWEPLASALAAGLTDLCTGTSDSSSPVAVPVGSYRIPPGTPGPIVTVITFALAQLGKPYEWGAIGPDAYDCSGLIQTAYAQIGIALPRTTYEQADAGIPVSSPAQLEPGDLVFIPGTDGTPSAPGHVGLYIGDGDVLQAPQTGDHVKITALTDWLSSVAAIRRPV